MDGGLLNQPRLHAAEPIGFSIGNLAGKVLQGMLAVSSNYGCFPPGIS